MAGAGWDPVTDLHSLADGDYCLSGQIPLSCPVRSSWFTQSPSNWTPFHLLRFLAVGVWSSFSCQVSSVPFPSHSIVGRPFCDTL